MVVRLSYIAGRNVVSTFASSTVRLNPIHMDSCWDEVGNWREEEKKKEEKEVAVEEEEKKEEEEEEVTFSYGSREL